MSDGITVDANVMNAFAKLYAKSDDGEVVTLIQQIESLKGFAIDDGGKIEKQWLDTCGYKPGSPFFEWFYERVKLGKIRYVRPHLHLHIKKELRIECGFPERSDRYEMTYLAVANVTKAKYLVSEDIHFYEPSQKNANEATKAKIKSSRNGSVCKLLARLEIQVGTVQHALVEIDHALAPTPPASTDGT